MTSYMVYKPHSALRPATRQRVASSHDRPAASSQHKETSKERQSSESAPCSTPRAATIALNPTSGQSARRFEHDIPDHILQAWPLVHKVHSRRPEVREGGTGTPATALTRRRTRNSQGVYRSSVLTPGEVEFMARKREARRHAALQQRGVTRSCTEFGAGNRAFMTQDASPAEVDGDISRDQYSRMTIDSRASIVPSTIEVTLPAQQRRDALRRMRRQDPQLRLAGTSVTVEGGSDGADVRATSALLGREKAMGNNIRHSGVRERRRREERRQEQQFILQPTSGPDWYESQGLQTPTVLHKYLSDSFYASSVTKPEVDTTSLLNYIRNKQKNSSYVPPPPSSGSGLEEEEEDDVDYQEVRMDASGHVQNVDDNSEIKLRQSVSCEDVSPNRAQPPPAMYVLERPAQGHLKGQGHVHGQGQAASERSGDRTSAPRRTFKDSGSLNLLVGGDSVGGHWSGHVTNDAGDWQVTGVSNLQIGDQGGHIRNKQQTNPSQAVSGRTISSEPPLISSEEVKVIGDTEGETQGKNEELSEDGHVVEKVDNTKRITVVLPSSDTSLKTAD